MQQNAENSSLKAGPDDQRIRADPNKLLDDGLSGAKSSIKAGPDDQRIKATHTPQSKYLTSSERLREEAQ